MDQKKADDLGWENLESALDSNEMMDEDVRLHTRTLFTGLKPDETLAVMRELEIELEKERRRLRGET